MAILTWSLLSSGSYAFNPNADVLNFDGPAISAADISIDSTAVTSSFTYGGKTVTLNTSQLTLTSTNVTFQNGSLFLVGDNTTGTASDDAANTLVGGAGNDQLIGVSGADSLSGAGGNDFFLIAGDAPSYGNDTINGGSGTDSIVYYLPDAFYGANVNLATGVATGGDGSPGSTLSLISIENVDGTDFNDVITGSSAANVLHGKGGDDTLAGGLGDDFLDGGAGFNDLADYAQATGSVTVNLTNGTASGADGNDTLLNLEGIRGGAFGDTLTGDAGANLLDGGAGNDTLDGGAGNDTLDGGAGIDSMTGGAGDDIYHVIQNGDVAVEGLDGGTDTIITDRGINMAANIENLVWQQLGGGGGGFCVGNDLDNVMTADHELGGLTMDGAGGSDTVSYVTQTVAVTVDLESGIATTGSSDFLQNIENAVGGSNDDTLIGTGGENSLDGSGGEDTMTGGAGDDIYFVDDAQDVVVETTNDVPAGAVVAAGSIGGIIDTVIAAINFSLANVAFVENLTLAAGAAITATGNTLANVLTGNAANNVLNGSIGNDTMAGGAGNDTYVRNAAGDVVTELASEGTDTVQSAVTYTLEANVENLTLTGAAAINGTGNTLNNILTGNTANNILTGSVGNDTLNGGLGNDTMAGGLGNDTYVRNAVGDVVTELAGQGIDTVQSAVSYTLGANVERLTLTGAAAINGVGNTLNNFLTGNSGANILNGALGNDTMAGGLGNDTYVRNVAGDLVTEEVDAGIDTVQSAVTYALGANVENLTLTGAGAINGTGNTLANALTGNTANNTLSGSSGNDTLNGGLGNDTMAGGNGNDTLVWDALDVSVNGGAGADVLRIDGTGQTLNLLTVPNTKIQNVEVINLTGSGDNRLELSLQDVLVLSSTTDTLRVDGNAGDVLDHNAGWAPTLAPDQEIGANFYRVYAQGAATLLVDTDITVTT